MSGESFPLLDLVTGTISGSIGETSAILIIAAGIFLIVKKAANFRIILAGLIGFFVMHSILFFAGVEGVVNPVYSVFTGSLLFGLVFMATDPISSSQTTNEGRWIFGLLIGLLISIIRVFSIWIEAVTFAILLANMFAPLLDHILKERRKKKKSGAAA
jgi:Na+-transporting NADH:ubiquinone oxidoreductase subunit B